MPKILLNVTHQKQAQQADCLAACAAMILDYLEQPVAYDRLIDLLNVRKFGAPAPNIRKLETLGLTILYERGELSDIETQLLRGLPCIAFVNTSELPYWTQATDHALVVVGLDDESIYLNDPAFPEAPRAVARGDFELAWLKFDQTYAVIQSV